MVFMRPKSKYERRANSDFFRIPMKSMQIRKLHPEIGAEIIGVTMADVANDDAAYRFVRAAFEEHSVLLFRKQPISDETQVAYSAKFGPLETAKAASLGEGTPFSILTNKIGRAHV